MHFPLTARFATLVLCLAIALPLHGEVDYVKAIKPLLRERCYSCHGALKQKAKLRLDTVELMRKGGKNGGVVVSGRPDESLLIERVTAAGVEDRMPPEHEGEPFTPAQVTLLREWISAGAPAPAEEQAETDPKEHWAFRARVRPPVPRVANPKWVRNPIDAFLAKQHEQHGLTPQPEASRAVLLRRLQLDLIGLPPTPAEITTFENDTSTGWYERAVERLLNDPRHGERWARHWMDIWRYSDRWGLGDELRNSQNHIWHWRDWIVESLNGDTPYDEMVRQMLAADELYPNDLQKLRATGFLARNWFLFSRHQWMEETVEHVSKGFLGLTINCAKCHDHKYDPITQVDYYKMRSFFEPYQVRMDTLPNVADLSVDGLPRVFDGLLDAPTYRFVRGDETKPDKATVIAPGVPEFLAFKRLAIQPVPLPLSAWQPERRPWVLDAQLLSARKKMDSAEQAIAPAREKLAAAQKLATEITVAQGELSVAELTAGLARVELWSLERRIAAARATWTAADAKAGRAKAKLGEIERENSKAAVRSEREVSVTKARLAIAQLDLRLARTAADKKPELEKELKHAGVSLEAAIKASTTPVAATNTFTPFEGAKWTTTRFVHPNKDDAPVTFPASSTGRRTALAGWITDPRHPLTARVAVNHLWSRHLGAPLAPNTFEFGRKGTAPANPELLDWLASELVASGWSMKHLHRLIVTSAAYRLSSSIAGGEANVAKDPDNRHWWRRSPIRIESQALRDSILALAGQLDPKMGGPSVPTAEQADSKRRSLYFFHSNNERNLFLTTFDEADVKECYRRDQSIVPQQALALSNSRLVLDNAGLIAGRLGANVLREDDAAFVHRAFRGVLGVPPGAAELAACVKTMQALRQLPDTSPDQARAQLVWALLNHNDFVTLR